MPDKNYLSLKHAQAAKAGQRATGKISYRILTEEMQRDALFITIVGNEGGGWFSNEIVPLAKIEALLEKHDSAKPLATKFFAPAFNSKSVNNAGFLAAVLRAEGLLQPAEPGSRLHLVSEEWDIWKAVMLSEPAEAYEPPVKTPANANVAENQHLKRQQKPNPNCR